MRIRSSTGQHRLEVSESTTFEDLCLLFYSLRPEIPLNSIKLSRTGRPTDVLVAKPTDTLSTLQIQHGDLLTLIEQPKPANSSSSQPSVSSSSTSKKLTNQCTHSEGGACIHCCSAQPGEKVTGKCNHPSSATCLHCASFTQDALSGKKGDAPAVWLCQHAPTAFCPKCLPPASEDMKLKPFVILRQNRLTISPPFSSLACSCDHDRGQFCSRCAESAAKKPESKSDTI